MGASLNYRITLRLEAGRGFWVLCWQLGTQSRNQVYKSFLLQKERQMYFKMHHLRNHNNLYIQVSVGFQTSSRAVFNQRILKIYLCILQMIPQKLLSMWWQISFKYCNPLSLGSAQMFVNTSFVFHMQQHKLHPCMLFCMSLNCKDVNFFFF